MTALVIAEHDNHSLQTGTLNTITAATHLGDVHTLVAGHKAGAAAQAAAQLTAVSAVWLADAPQYAYNLAENLAPLIAGIAKNYSHILAPATSFGKNLLPRIAALLDVAPISDVIAIESADTFVRPIYTGNALATVQSHDTIKLLTIRTTAFDLATVTTGKQLAAQPIATTADMGLSTFICQALTQSTRPELGSAKIIVSGGRALGSAEQFKAMVETLADKLHAAVGASRAAVDAGYAPNDYQVGQTGKMVAPQLYIAVGISGAIQHLAGILGSKVIVAINQDEDAPIFQVADYGLVGDLFKIVPELINALP